MAKLLRLDKFLCDQDLGTRSEVKTLLKKGWVTVNGCVQKSPDFKINPETDEVAYRGTVLQYQEFYYYMLHKPAGVITATEDSREKTVMSLLGDAYRKDLFPVGRLDKDTEGLLLITNDGELSHALLSPSKHVPKTYLAEVPGRLNPGQIEALERGVDIGDDKLTAPAKVETVDDTHIHLTIHEGRYHQVKRMLSAVGSRVLYLKRISFGKLALDASLEKGCYRALTEDEILCLRENQSLEQSKIVESNIDYFLSINTAENSIQECADMLTSSIEFR